MKVNANGFWGYCKNCNTDLTQIKYEEIAGFEPEEVVVCYETHKKQAPYVVCPICGEKVKIRPYSSEVK